MCHERDTCWISLLRTAAHEKDSVLKFMCKGFHTGTREDSDKKGTKCFGLTATDIPLPLKLLGEGTKVGSEDKYRKKRRIGGSCFQIFSHFR